MEVATSTISIRLTSSTTLHLHLHKLHNNNQNNNNNSSSKVLLRHRKAETESSKLPDTTKGPTATNNITVYLVGPHHLPPNLHPNSTHHLVSSHRNINHLKDIFHHSSTKAACRVAINAEEIPKAWAK